jgi:hypothetical protein
MSGHLTREEKDHWKESVINSRFEDFKELKGWLILKNINFSENNFGIELQDFNISNTLKIKFPNTRKEYQYNIDGIKERLKNNYENRI